MAAGEAKSDLLWLIMVVALLAVAWFVTGGPNNPGTRGGPFIRPPEGTQLGETYGDLGEDEGSFLGFSWRRNRQDKLEDYTLEALKSPWYGKINLEKGTAARESWPDFEYIVLKSASKEPVTISGWSLKNGGDERGYTNNQGEYVVGRAKWAIIPNGTKVYKLNSQNPLLPITLNYREKAVISSGRPPKVGDLYVANSFKTNLCTGYFDFMSRDNFYPSLSRSCPKPDDEPGYNNLSEECTDYVDDLSRCEVPKLTREEENDLSPTCRRFLLEHYSYNGCLTYHQNSLNYKFDGTEWRVFLAGTEMWRESNESITLYDQNGKLVDRLTY